MDRSSLPLREVMGFFICNCYLYYTTNIRSVQVCGSLPRMDSSGLDILESEVNCMNRLRVLMAQKGLQSRELAYMSGVSERTISRLINGHGNPTYDTAYALADALSVHIQTIFPDIDYVHRNKKRPS